VLNPITHRKVLKNGVPGQATIVEMGALDRDSSICNLPMTLQVHVEGWTPYETEGQWMVKAKDTVGLSGSIPVRVDPDDHDKVAIDWDGVRANYEQHVDARRQALAQGGLGGANVTFQSQEIDLTQNPEAAARVMQALGLSGANVGFGQQSPAGDDDPIARLERLGALKASGVLTEDEFQAQKRRILGESG
jgi:hypothetical protein